MRITHHPILGDLAEAETFEIIFDGQPIPARDGDTIASALIANGVKVFRRTPKRRPVRIFEACAQSPDLRVEGIAVLLAIALNRRGEGSDTGVEFCPNLTQIIIDCLAIGTG